MDGAIIDTGYLAEIIGKDAEDDVANMSATKGATEAPMEFHVQMKGHTFRDMEELIVHAAATQIIGYYGGRAAIQKQIEASCIAQVTARADAALGKVAAEIIDQPLTPSYGDKKPVTMREFIGLTGREYLTERVDRDGKPTTSTGWGSSQTCTRIELLVSQFMQRAFKTEIEKATNAAISEVQKAIRDEHATFLAAEKARIREAIAKASA